MTKKAVSRTRWFLVVCGITGSLAVGTIGAGLATRGAGPDVSPSRSTSHRVEIRGLRFQASDLDVTEGDTIVWVNRDVVPHTVAALDGSWSSGDLARGEAWRMVVTVDGPIPYYCEYHPTMRGWIR